LRDGSRKFQWVRILTDHRARYTGIITGGDPVFKKFFRGCNPRTPLAGGATPPAPSSRSACGLARGRFAPPAPQSQMPTFPRTPKFSDRSPPLGIMVKMDYFSCSSLFCLECVAARSLVVAVTSGLRPRSHIKSLVLYFAYGRLAHSVGGKAVISVIVYTCIHSEFLKKL
jgi:hypothetical protein